VHSLIAWCKNLLQNDIFMQQVCATRNAIFSVEVKIVADTLVCTTISEVQFEYVNKFISLDFKFNIELTGLCPNFAK